MERLTLAAPAKLNLRLLVGSVRSDGYHPIRSLMVTLDGLADTIHLAPAAERAVDCPGVAQRDNLVWHALDALEARVGRRLPCHVAIDKQIPSEAGLGGGSSDAAAVLVGASRLFYLDLSESDLESVAAEVGSDVPFFVRGGAQWAEGRGEHLTPCPAPRFTGVIVTSPVGLSTRDVYATFDQLPRPAPDDGRPPPSGMPALAHWVRNDLWDAARTMQPALQDVADRLRAAGAEASLLCGSGSAMAGLFDDAAAARAACAAVGGTIVRPAPPRA